MKIKKMKQIKKLIIASALLFLIVGCKEKCNENMNFKEYVTVYDTRSDITTAYTKRSYFYISRHDNFVPSSRIEDIHLYSDGHDTTLLLKYDYEGFRNFEDFFRKNECSSLYLYNIDYSDGNHYWGNNNNTTRLDSIKKDLKKRIELNIESLNSNAWKYTYE
ncbi:MAG: hypothetical protein H6578_11070 [Chitinophagales bacterium]|nr:hypothetical protein [Chitinophagales bacterium]